MKKITLIILLLAAVVALQAAEPDFKKVLLQMDQMMNFDTNDFSAVMTMVSVDPEEGTTVRKVSQFRRDKEDKFLMLMLAPEDQKGQGYLRSGDNMWMYDPVSRKFSHFSLKESFEGTDARNSDFRMSSTAEDYDVAGYTEGRLGKYEVYILDLAAKHDEVTYPAQKVWVRRDNYLVLKSESYSLTGRLLRTSLFPGYAKVGDKYVATSMIFRDELIAGKKTQVTITDISIDKLPDSVFTKSYVERVNN